MKNHLLQSCQFNTPTNLNENDGTVVNHEISLIIGGKGVEEFSLGISGG